MTVFFITKPSWGFSIPELCLLASCGASLTVIRQALKMLQQPKNMHIKVTISDTDWLIKVVVPNHWPRILAHLERNALKEIWVKNTHLPRWDAETMLNTPGGRGSSGSMISPINKPFRPRLRWADTENSSLMQQVASCFFGCYWSTCLDWPIKFSEEQSWSPETYKEAIMVSSEQPEHCSPAPAKVISRCCYT